MGNEFQLIIPCEARIISLQSRMDYAVRNKNYEEAGLLKKEIEALKLNPEDEAIPCNAVTLKLQR
jgi:protein-arginine kinase activator protein McsA